MIRKATKEEKELVKYHQAVGMIALPFITAFWIIRIGLE
jgi:hypothetical protein